MQQILSKLEPITIRKKMMIIIVEIIVIIIIIIIKMITTDEMIGVVTIEGVMINIENEMSRDKKNKKFIKEIISTIIKHTITGMT